jgi:hypothetical protein
MAALVERRRFLGDMEWWRAHLPDHFMRRVALLLIVGFSSAVLLFLPAMPVTGSSPIATEQFYPGGNTVTVEGTVVTIHVPITFLEVFPEDWQAIAVLAKTDPFVADFSKYVPQLWNDALAKYQNGCFTIQVAADILKEEVVSPDRPYPFKPPNDPRSTSDTIVINWANPTDRPTTTFPIEVGKSGDSDLVYQYFASGEWPPLDVGDYISVYAHEFGHLLGLSDDYTSINGPDGSFDHAEAKPGRAGTIMEPGLEIDQNIVDRLVSLLSKTNKLPSCWQGTEHMNLAISGPGCSVTVDGTLRMVVSGEGKVSGTAKGSWLYVHTSCGLGSQSSQETVPITGTLTSTEFQLTIPLGLFGTQLPVTVPLTSAKTAHADGTDHPGAATRTYTIDLTCDQCAGSVPNS